MKKMSIERKTPKRRFKEFQNGESWEHYKVSEITLFNKQGFYTTESYGETKKYFLLRGTDLSENKLILKDTPKIDASEKDYKDFKAQVGDFLIVRSGTVGTYGIVNIDIPAIFGSYLIDFRFDKSVVINEFFGYFYQSSLFKDQLRQIIQQSANTNINAENIKSTHINLPSIEEQKKIAKFVESLDNTITTHQHKLEKLKALKKAYLAQMFPSEGEFKPKLRFAGFNDEWEQRKLSDITNSFSGGTPSVVNKLFYCGNIPFIRSGEISSNRTELFISEDGLNNSSAKLVEQGDILYALYGATSGEVSISKISGAINQAILAIKPLNEYNADFLMQWLRKEKVNIISTYLQGGQGNLSGNIVKGLLIYIPKKKSEQDKIGSFFAKIDNLITLHQRKLEKLQNLKKAYLNEMFI